MNQPDFQSLWKYVDTSFRNNVSFIHGINHFRAVEKNGMMLAEQTGAELVCIRLFAMFHDIKRENDGTDPKHGIRSADLIYQLNGFLFKLDHDCIEKLTYACKFHTDGLISDDPTIGSCWDADRLDLVRIGIQPQPELLSTTAAKQYIKSISSDLQSFK